MKAGRLIPVSEVFVSIPDPRSKRHAKHDLSELLTVAVCAVLCGADDFVDVALWGKSNLKWLRKFLKLKAGVPSHDTFCRVFAMIDPAAFEAAFLRWVGVLVPALAPGSVVSVDGKTSRRTGGKDTSGPLHMVSAFAAGMAMVLGQLATDKKSNEISAIPELLAMLALEGTIVTIDAMGTQTAIARTIRNKGADYVLCVKDNHPKLTDSILFTLAGVAGKIAPASHVEEQIKSHGRLETRRCWAFEAVGQLYKAEQWAGLKSFAVIERERTVEGKTSRERHFYISSLPADAAKIAHAVRSHWSVENQLHWSLDVQFNDDQTRVRRGYAANNLVVLRHIVLNLLRHNTSRKVSIKSKRLLACIEDEFREQLLGFAL
jgi:predicted transposase YbfD/YdcC